MWRLIMVAATSAAAAAAAAAFVWRWRHDEILALRDELARESELRQAERRGRTSAEKKLRAVMEKSTGASAGAETQQAQQQAGATRVVPIGTLESCFPERNGTPRQSLLVDEGRAVLRLNHRALGFEARDAVDGLEGFSHVWLIFLFHENTNAQRQLRAHTGVPAKVTPPRLGKRVGLFATRTPHRPNPIGLSLARLERIDETGALHLRGVDLIDGTPILDIKGYLKRYEALPDAVNPEWIDERAAPDFDEVVFEPHADEQLRGLLDDGQLRLFAPGERDAFGRLVSDVLAYDIRPLHRKTGERSELEHSVKLDKVRLTYHAADRRVSITSVELDR